MSVYIREDHPVIILLPPEQTDYSAFVSNVYSYFEMSLSTAFSGMNEQHYIFCLLKLSTTIVSKLRLSSARKWLQIINGKYHETGTFGFRIKVRRRQTSRSNWNAPGELSSGQEHSSVGKALACSNMRAQTQSTQWNASLYSQHSRGGDRGPQGLARPRTYPNQKAPGILGDPDSRNGARGNDWCRHLTMTLDFIPIWRGHVSCWQRFLSRPISQLFSPKETHKVLH